MSYPATPCRKILFKNPTQTWGYPLSHLLAMHLTCDKHDSPSMRSHIELYFSAETVDIFGESLTQLWEKLVADPAIVLDISKQEANEFNVMRIEIRKEAPPTEK